MKKLLKKLFILGTISTMLVVNVSALEPSWNMAGGGYGEKEEYERFWPTNGEVSATFKSDYATTRIRFSYDSATVKQLAQYQKDDLYPGIDIKTISSGFDYDLFNAYSIITTLPNPVEDYENDDPLGSRDEEAEVTSLGGIKSDTTYSMSVYWDDYRDGSRSSHWRVQGELSKKGVKDYNVQDYKYLAKLDYGPNKGSRNISTEESNANTQLAKTESTYGIPTTITFNDYLSFDEFSDFCTNMPVDVVKLQLRGLTSSGERVSIFTRTDKGLDETETLIREQLDNESMSFVGITSVYALVPSEYIDSIGEFPSVYSAESYNSNFHAENGVNENESNTNLSSSFPVPKTWELEDSGLLNMRHSTGL